MTCLPPASGLSALAVALTTESVFFAPFWARASADQSRPSTAAAASTERPMTTDFDMVLSRYADSRPTRPVLISLKLGADANSYLTQERDRKPRLAQVPQPPATEGAVQPAKNNFVTKRGKKCRS